MQPLHTSVSIPLDYASKGYVDIPDKGQQGIREIFILVTTPKNRIKGKYKCMARFQLPWISGNTEEAD